MHTLHSLSFYYQILTIPRPQGYYSKVNNVFCLSLLCLLDRSYGSIPSRARSDRNVLGGSHGLPPHSSMYRYTNSGRSSLRPFYSSFSVNDLKVLKVLKV